ncbi:MAG: TlpA family protein disulfide reductase [Clostridia bacterium]|nr:TlpA family protein disulfide reductase [Clostridia bacterium]
MHHAPDFVVYDLAGNAVRLSDYIGKPIVLNFWASWCGPCKMEMPDFDEVYRQYGDEVQFLMVNLTDGSYETVATAAAFVAQNGYAFPVLFDTSGQAANTYQIYSIPTTYFIDAGGHLIARAEGAIDAASLQYGISLIR